MGLIGKIFSDILVVITNYAGILGILFILGLLVFSCLSLSLYRRLHLITSALSAMEASHKADETSSLLAGQRDIVSHFLSLNRDIDEARRKLAITTAEREAEREEAQRADRNKTRFLATASHDLRQPLQALGLFVAALAQRPLPNDIKEIVDKIEDSLAALEDLLDGLLDISRLEAGAIEAHSASFPLQSLFDRMALEFEPLAERKGLTMQLVRTSAVVRSDPALLERILRNLLSNAIRYTRSGGVVVGCRRRNKDLRIEVWDSGTGIAESDQKDVFQEFRQLTDDSSETRQGLGLGLAIVERLVNLLDLQIELQSTVGKGSTFTIILPAHPRSYQQSQSGNVSSDKPV
jgi:signal transduction histidine kinase